MLIHKYRIMYIFPWGSVQQDKILVSHEEWKRFAEAEKRLLLVKGPDETSKEDKEIVKEFKRLYGDQIFTDQSPIYHAVQTGTLKTEYTECRVTFTKTNLHKID